MTFTGKPLAYENYRSINKDDLEQQLERNLLSTDDKKAKINGMIAPIQESLPADFQIKVTGLENLSYIMEKVIQIYHFNYIHGLSLEEKKMIFGTSVSKIKEEEVAEKEHMKIIEALQSVFNKAEEIDCEIPPLKISQYLELNPFNIPANMDADGKELENYRSLLRQLYPTRQ